MSSDSAPHHSGENVMRRPFSWFVLAISAVLIAGNFAKAETPADVVKKAIEAHGGADNLKKYAAAKIAAKGKIFLMGLEIAVEMETTYLLPDMFKNIMKMDILCQKVTIVQVYNAGKVKMTANGMDTPVSDTQKAELQESMNLQHAQQLTPLLEGQKYELTLIDNPANVGSKEVVGITVKSKDRKDFKLFFDKATNLLVRIERRGLNEAEKEVDQQITYSAHKKFDGIMRPVKTEFLMDGKKFMEGEVSEYKHLDKVDKKVFDLSD